MHKNYLLLNFFLISMGYSQIPECIGVMFPDWPLQWDVRQLITPMPLICETDSLIGNLLYIRGGTFTQGPMDDPCEWPSETSFTHTLSRNLLVMETEVTRQMWLELRLLQTDLPQDPSNTTYSPGMDYPVQQATWSEALLFANLLSLEQGLTVCYYKDPLLTDALNVTNYTTGEFHCDFDADGYRLPTEGEFEYYIRAGTTGPFSISEPNYNTSTCSTCTTASLLTSLETVAIFCKGVGPTIAGVLDANPWGLKDIHGNVEEMCWDFYWDYPTGSQTDYTRSISGISRIMRGGSWRGFAGYCRSAFRNSIVLGSRINIFGFRLVRTTL